MACRQESTKAGLWRLVGVSGSAVLDATGHLPGRGAYLHRNPQCLQLGRKRRVIERSLKVEVAPELWSLLEASPQG